MRHRRWAAVSRGGLLQALTRDGFDPTRHPLSLLSLGELGWVQIANFVVTGVLYLACAVGMWRVLASAIQFGFVAAVAARLIRGLPDVAVASPAAWRARRLKRAS
jgi:hypothetical protein